MKNIAIFASGNGSNAQRIAEYFTDSPDVNICLILSNNPTANVLNRAEALNIPSFVFTASELNESSIVLDKLRECEVDFIVLSGFLLLIPTTILEAWDRKIINIHPALLPKYGGKGMYGNNVHKAVIESGDRESGITIHYVNSNYDEGDIIYQTRCPVMRNDTPDTLAARIHPYEYEFYPQVIEKEVFKVKSEK